MKEIKAIIFSKIPDNFGTQIGFAYEDRTDLVAFEKEIDFETLKFINAGLERLLQQKDDKNK